MNIRKDIESLIKANVINQDTAKGIEQYYNQKNISFCKTGNMSFQVVIFSILGSVLISTGIIFIFAHSWENFSLMLKTVIAFLPLLLAQAICIYLFVKKIKSRAWIEGSASFLFFTLGVTLALISQIYHIQGDEIRFLKTLLLLILPVVYVFRSSALVVLYLLSTVFIAESFLFFASSSITWEMLLGVGVFLFIIPYCIYFQKKYPHSAIITLQNWCIGIAMVFFIDFIIVCVDNVYHVVNMASMESFIYMFVYGIFYVFGNRMYTVKKSIGGNSYKMIGLIGVIIMMMLSIMDSWFYSFQINATNKHLLTLIILLILYCSICVSIRLVRIKKYGNGIKLKDIFLFFQSGDIFELAPIVFSLLGILNIGLLYIIPSDQEVVLYMINGMHNVFILFTGVVMLIQRKDYISTKKINLGMTIIMLWIVIQFFYVDFSYIFRGLLFLLLGLIFLSVNFLIIRIKRNQKND